MQVFDNLCFTYYLHLGHYCCMLSTSGSSVHQVCEPRVRVHGASGRAGETWTGWTARLFSVSVVWPHTDSGRAVCVQVSAHRTGRHEFTSAFERGRGQLDCPAVICVVVNKGVSFMYNINGLASLEKVHYCNNSST